LKNIDSGRPRERDTAALAGVSLWRAHARPHANRYIIMYILYNIVCIGMSFSHQARLSAGRQNQYRAKFISHEIGQVRYKNTAAGTRPRRCRVDARVPYIIILCYMHAVGADTV